MMSQLIWNIFPVLYDYKIFIKKTKHFLDTLFLKKLSQYLCSIYYHLREEVKKIIYGVFRKTAGILDTFDSSKREKLSMLRRTGFSFVLTLSTTQLINTSYYFLEKHFKKFLFENFIIVYLIAPWNLHIIYGRVCVIKIF